MTAQLESVASQDDIEMVSQLVDDIEQQINPSNNSKIVSSLFRAIENGVAAYRAGDYKDCTRCFNSASELALEVVENNTDSDVVQQIESDLLPQLEALSSS